MGGMRTGTLQWAVGVFCATTGILMLLAPHQFRVPEYAVLRPYLPWLGCLMVLAGGALVGVATLRGRKGLLVPAHLLGAAALLALAASFVESGVWTGVVNYTVLALALALAPLGARGSSPPETREGGDLFALAIGAGAAINGLLFLFTPDLFGARLYVVSRPFLGWYGAAFLAGGVALVVSHARPSVPGLAIKAAGWLIAGAFFAFGLPNVGQATWTGAVYYGGFGALLALLPWAAPQLRRINLASLRARLALSLAMATSVPLLLIVVVGAEYNEHQAVAQALSRQQAQAAMLAQHIADRVGQHRATIESLAGYPGLLLMTAEAQQGLLKSLYAAGPRGAGFSTLDSSGKEIAHSGDVSLNLGDVAGYPTPEEAQQLPAGYVLKLQSAGGERPVVVFWAPLRDRSGRFGGSIATGIDASHLASFFSRADLDADDEAFLVDGGTGRLLARSVTAAVGFLDDSSIAPPTAALVAGEMGPGALDYVTREGERVAGYARVPGLDWGVIVQRPRAVALASIFAGRDLSSLILMLVLALGLVSGALTAGFLTAPLDALARAVERLGAGDTKAPLPQSGIAEVGRLAAVFGEMRDRLAARTAERERAEDALRFLAEASSVLSSSLDYETTLTSVARLAVPRLADWCTVSVVDEEGMPRRVAMAHVDPSKEPLLRELHRRYPLEMGHRHPISVVLRTGEPWIMEEVPADQMEATGNLKELFHIMRELGLRSSMVVPLKAQGRVLGAILLALGSSGRRYSAGDLTLAQDLARRCALAVENARLYQEAQQAIRARDEFLSVAAHELKTPITSLRGFAQVTIRHLQRESSPDPIRIRRALEVIDRQSDRLTRLVVQLLDVSRIQAGRLVLHPEQADLADLVAGVVANAQAATSKHNLVLRTPSSVWASVDPIRLEQVVTNLVDNAIKYSPEGGDIVVELGLTERGAVQLSVSDHGIGIPPEYRARIFDRFYQVDDGGYAGGMGLGLYISRHIVELHGGRIDVEAPPDGGTRFVVSLPVNGNGASSGARGGDQ